VFEESACANFWKTLSLNFSGIPRPWSITQTAIDENGASFIFSHIDMHISVESTIVPLTVIPVMKITGKIAHK
jgi:hypothetical protein